MKLVTFRADGPPRLGALLDGEVADLAGAGVAAGMAELIAAGAEGLGRARIALEERGTRRLPLTAVRLLAPVPRPGKVLCCGINYASHAEENPKAVMPKEPFFFAKVASSVVGPEDEIAVPPMSSQVDYEVELAVVIGRRLARAAPAEVMGALFGYTLLNDVSARDVQFKDNQITLGKNFDGFAPIGPAIVTPDDLPDPGSVRLRTRLNGRTMQDGNTAEWLFPLPRLLSFLSGVMALEPGDIVSTGTPAGVGYFRNPQVFMKPGDIVEIEGEGIGVLRNRMVA
jgi:2-keto-4-pentenoate hydratase/2-oxohepta-3-ene-1,7-dioic acid hydratase in catechol pathway